jgi:hypothetical protein
MDLLAHGAQFFAANNLLASTGMTSFHWRVFKPQSGFTHKRSAGIRFAAFNIRIRLCDKREITYRD